MNVFSVGFFMFAGLAFWLLSVLFPSLKNGVSPKPESPEPEPQKPDPARQAVIEKIKSANKKASTQKPKT
jgi:hypothetical protein